MFRDRRGLEALTRAFDVRLTVVQRTISRLGGARVLDALTIKIDKARTLRTISSTLTGILDIIRYVIDYS